MDSPGEHPSDLRPGLLLEGRYRLSGLIARGGMATVYTGVDERLDRTVAVKVMHRSLAEDPDFVARFSREARSAARLSAPEVVAVFDQGRDEQTGLAYLVMEYVQGRNLRDLLRQRGALSPPRALSIMEPVLRALAAAHQAGLVHRDIKPENVLLGDDGRIKVADFGLARAVEASNATATTGLLIGTVAYLAPEQVQQGIADTRTDVYAAGVVLWEMLTGRPPYDGNSPLSIAYRHVNEDIPSPAGLTPVPPALDQLVVRATRRDPQQRPVDGRAFLAELTAIRAALPHAAAPPGPGPAMRTLPATGTAPPFPSARPVAFAAPPDRAHDTLVVPWADAAGTGPVGIGSGRAGPPGVGSLDNRPPELRAAGVRVPTVVQGRPGRRRRRALYALLLVVLALAAGGAWYLGSGRFTTIPGVLATPVAEAEQKLRGQGFAVTVLPDRRFDEQVPTGQVLTQRPEPGSRVARHATVVLTISKGADRRVVPGLVGMSRDAATAALQGAGLRAGSVTSAYSTQSSGNVVSSDPPAGQPVRADTAVALVLSKGPERLPVPGVTGQAQGEAVAALQAAGFTTTVEEVFDDNVPIGSVARQSPGRGTADRGSAVALSVSKGPDLVIVPDVTGLKRGDAQAALAAAGVKARVVAIPGPGTVRSQDPGRGAQVKRGSTVTLFVF